MVVTDRGQAHTVEAFSAAVVLLASVVFALQVTAVTPLTASTASQHIENQQAGVGGGVLDEAAESGTLMGTVLYVNETSGRFHNSGDQNRYIHGGPPTAFGETLNQTFLDRGIAFNLAITYHDGSSIGGPFRIVDLGRPSDNAVTVHRTLTVFDDDHLYDDDNSKDESTTVSDAGNLYFQEDQSPESPVYNVITVRLTLWRM